MTRRTRVRPLVLLLGATLTAAAALAASACGRDGAPAPQRTVALTQLSSAIGAVNTTRAAAVADATAVVDGVRAVDRVDALAAKADRTGARDARRAGERTRTAATAAVRRLVDRARAYAAAADQLAAAATTATALTAGQRQAVADVVAAARAEARADEVFAGTANGAWRVYLELDHAQELWIMRAGNGWYRTAQESAAAYAVLRPGARVSRAGADFARVDRARAEAAAATARAVGTARTALGDLVDASPTG